MERREPAADWRTHLLVAACIVAIGCALYLPFLDRAWTSNEQNASSHSVFNQNWERFGFFHMWGLEVVPIVPSLDHFLATAYVNHPPAMAWVVYAFGMSEWQMRIPTFLSVMALGFLVYRLLLPRLGVWTAAIAGALIVLPPTMSVHAQMSYELTVAVLGIGMLLAHDLCLRHGFKSASGGWLALCAFLGPWFDWSFCYVYCLALVAWTVGRAPLVRALALPAVASGLSLALLMVWRGIVTTRDHLPKVPEGQEGIRELLMRVWGEFFERGLGDTLHGAWQTLLANFTAPVMIAAAFGLVPLIRRAPRVAAVLAFGLVHPLLIPSHAADHAMFFVYLGPLFVAGAATATAACAEGRRGLQLGLAAGLLLLPAGTAAWRHLESTTSNFYRDLGQVLTEAVGDDEYVVGHGWPYGVYIGYVRSVQVFPHSTRDPAVLGAAAQTLKPKGAKFLWLRFGRVPSFAQQTFAEPAGLATLLEPLPKRRVSRLETTFDVTGKGDVVEITEAWLVTLGEPD